MTTYKEFSSFYEMKEWLKKGEFTLPAVYKTLNDNKYYYDYALFSENSNFNLYDIMYFNGIQGFTFNSNNEVSKVLSEHMDSTFVNKNVGRTDKEGKIHYNSKLSLPYDAEGFSFKEFSYFKHYGSIRKKAEAQQLHVHNMIAPHQFKGSPITEIYIPEGIEYIGADAFYKCEALEKVILPSTLKRIGSGAFKGCFRITEIYIPDSVEVIENGAFMSCTGLKTVTISEGVTEIGHRAFYNTAIEKIRIPNSVRKVGEKAFAYCQKLKTVYIGENCNINNTSENFMEDGHLNAMAFYKAPVEEFHVNKNNEWVMTGVNGELMVRMDSIRHVDHGITPHWMIIKVPYSFEGMYVADGRACSMIRNLFEGADNFSNDASYRCSNIGKLITGINFNNIQQVPKSLCARTDSINELVMPNVMYINKGAFNNKAITKIIPNNQSVIEVKDDNIRHAYFAKNCQIETDNLNYKSHPVWGKYMVGTSPIIEVQLLKDWEYDSSEKLYHSMNSDHASDDEIYNNSYSYMRIHFKNAPNFSIKVVSSSEEHYDYLMVTQMDYYAEDVVAVAVDSAIDSGDNSYIVNLPDNISTIVDTRDNYNDINRRDEYDLYCNVDLSNDGKEHFVEIYYIKDISANSGYYDRGFVKIPDEYNVTIL